MSQNDSPAVKALRDDLRGLHAEWRVRRFPAPHPQATWTPADLREMIVDVIAEIRLHKHLAASAATAI